MKLSITQKVLSIALLAIVALVVLFGSSYYQLGALRQSNDHVLVVSQALQAQQFADMMHDAIRGDVNSAIIAAHDHDARALETAATSFRQHAVTIREKIEINRHVPLGDAVAERLASIQNPLDDYVALAGKVIELSANDQAAARSLGEKFESAFGRMETAMAQLSEAIAAEGDRANLATAVANRRAALTMLAVAAGFALLLIALSLFVGRSIPLPFIHIIDEMHAAALANASSAKTVAEASSTLAAGASQQAASIEETSATLEEISSMAKRNADSAQRAKDLAAQTRTATDSGTREVAVMNEAMAAIKNSSDDIAKIIKTIDEIAFQTNILALNAAVEAARAGESGAGFAVVAEEVRALAQRSATAAKETAAKIEDSVTKSHHGAEVCSRVSTHLTEIAGKTREVDELIAEIATASSEQTQGISQVNQAISQMDRVVQSSAARAEESSGVARELTQHSSLLQSSVNELALVVGGNRLAAADPASVAPSPAARETRPTAKRDLVVAG